MSVNFKNNVSNVDKLKGSNLMGLIHPGPTTEYFDDFFTYNAGEWKVTETAAGSGANSVTNVDGNGGVIQMTTDNAANDGILIQLGTNSAINSAFEFDLDHDFFYEARIALDHYDATKMHAFIGLCGKADDEIFDNFRFQDSIGHQFTNVGGFFPADFYVRYGTQSTSPGSEGNRMATWNGTGQGISGTSVVNQVPFPSDGEFCTLGVSYDSKSQLISWTYQGVLIQRAAFDDRLTGQKTTNAVETWAYPKGVLVPTLGVRTKEASANSMKVDYFRCGMRRRDRV
tara:strand:+ start:5886 stop:6740 length:855 start_codon:yes stop_codon:yes gene_type:complete